MRLGLSLHHRNAFTYKFYFPLNMSKYGISIIKRDGLRSTSSTSGWSLIKKPPRIGILRSVVATLINYLSLRPYFIR